MKMKLQEKYLPIDEYTNKFRELSIHSCVSKIESQIIVRYKSGLRDNIQSEVLTVQLVSIEETY